VQPAPIDVIVDVLIGFLAKPSAHLRGVANMVYSSFCDKLTAKSMDLIFDVSFHFLFLLSH
jgi:DNA polymerase phi